MLVIQFSNLHRCLFFRQLDATHEIWIFVLLAPVKPFCHIFCPINPYSKVVRRNVHLLNHGHSKWTTLNVLRFLLFWIAACMKRGEIWARVFIPSNFLGWNCETSPPSGIIWFDIPRYDRRRLETGHNFMFLVIWPIIITGMYIWNDGTPLLLHNHHSHFF